MFSPEFYDDPKLAEIILKHLAQSSACLKKAKDLKLRSEDFLTSSIAGNRTYELFAKLILQVNEAPLSPELFASLLKFEVDKNPGIKNQAPAINKLYTFIFYTHDLNPVFINEELKNWIRRRREEKIKFESLKDTERLKKELDKVAIDLSFESKPIDEVFISPFARPLIPVAKNLIPFGVKSLDAKAGGIGYGDFALLLGFSGHGKTTLSLHMAKNLALRGYKVAYVERELTIQELSNRVYSNVFRIPYNSFRHGQNSMEILNGFGSIDQDRLRLLNENLKFVDAKQWHTCNKKSLQEYFDRMYEETGWAPDLDMFDQLDYYDVETDVQEWQKYKVASFELDDWSHYLIGGEKPHATLVNHQLNGDVKPVPTKKDIADYKGIDKPTDLTMYLGRAGLTSNVFTLGSFKARHTANFKIDLLGDLEYQGFSEANAAIPNGQFIQQNTT